MSATMQFLKETDLAWSAGFIDGEGCIALCHHRQKQYECYVLRLSVTNTDLLALDRLKTMFGGSINKSTHRNRPRNKPCWTWYCMSAKAENALRSLLPYLLTKKEQAELGLLSRQYIQSNGVKRSGDAFDNQAAIYGRLKLLKRVV